MLLIHNNFNVEWRVTKVAMDAICILNKTPPFFSSLAISNAQTRIHHAGFGVV